MPSLTVSLSMRSTFTMIRPSMTMLSLSLRERMSIDGGELAGGGAVIGSITFGRKRVGFFAQKGRGIRRRKAFDEGLHPLEGAAQHLVIETGALADAAE